MLRRLRPLAALLAATTVAAACSGSDDATSTTRSSALPVTAAPATSDSTDTGLGSDVTSPVPTTLSDRIGCRVEVTGAVETEFTAKNDADSFSSDYYKSQQEIDAANTRPGDDTDPLPTDTTVFGEEGDLTLPPKLPGTAPVVSWFLLNCQGGDITVNLLASLFATKDDVPFGPGRYDLTGQGGGEDPKVFSALAVFGANPTPDEYVVQEGGHLQIDRFDTKGAKGSFSFPMKNTAGQELEVKGDFDVTCGREDGQLCAATG